MNCATHVKTAKQTMNNLGCSTVDDFSSFISTLDKPSQRNTRIILENQLEILERDRWNQSVLKDRLLMIQQREWLDALVKNGSIVDDFGNKGTYQVNKDGTIDIYGSVNLENEELAFDKIPVKFNRIYGNFNCSHTKLISLRGAPRIVDGGFWCEDCNLDSLEGGPEIVSGDVKCAYNKLTSLNGSPTIVDGDFNCSHNKLITLKGAPKTVGGRFDCTFNELTSLEYSIHSGYNPVSIYEGNQIE